LGAVINEATIPTLKCKIIAGAANNILKDAEHDGKKIHDMGILYAPDYVINAGGLINVYQEIIGYDYDSVIRQIDIIYDRIREIIRTSKETDTPTYLVADMMAEKRIQMMSAISSIYLGK
jgi:leucine dehydrogenase